MKYFFRGFRHGFAEVFFLRGLRHLILYRVSKRYRIRCKISAMRFYAINPNARECIGTYTPNAVKEQG